MAFLVLGRKPGEGFTMTLEDGRRIYVKVDKHGPEVIRVAIDAPRSIGIARDEIQEKIDREIADKFGIGGLT